MKKLILAFAAALFLVPHPGICKQNFIQMKGSDTMVNLGQAWTERYMEKNPQGFIAVTGGGSGTGLASLISGTCDIAMSSRSISEKERAMARQKGVDPKETTVALDGLAVVVHPSNPVDKLTMEQLADIFSGKIINWKELGGADAKIVILSREVNSGTHVYFKEHVLRKSNPADKTEFAPSALLLSSSQAIADEIAGNTSAIGYYGMGYVSAKQKTVSLAPSGSTVFVGPKIENVLDGSYPLSRPLFIYTNGAPAGDVEKFVSFILSFEGQKVVAETDFVPVKNN
jgi:phosphate transport system substrate-binding protein